MFYKTCVIVLMVCSVSVYVLYTYNSPSTFMINPQTAAIKSKPIKDNRYLVSGPKCKIPNFEPFNQDIVPLHKLNEYKNCSKFPLLSYVGQDAKNAVLYINETAIPFYNALSLNCCFSYITRFIDKVHGADNEIRVGKCIEFKTNVTVTEDIVLVNCTNSKNTTIYTNVHAIIRAQNKTKDKIKPIGNKTHVSVLLIGIDSVSRLNLIRSLPKTYKFLQEQHWLELTGYNKVGDNTFPNVMAILTGMNESKSYETCITGKDSMDNCSMLWYDYRRLGYVTAYAEDEAKINTFNYNKKGFHNPPTDYYFRPYMLAINKLLKVVNIDNVGYCTGPETSGERVLYLIKNFAKTFAKYLYFGFFWMNSFSHNDLNSVSRMDTKIYQLLDDLVTSQVLNNTILFFFSDHGLRFGKIRHTTSGWLEERLPFFYIYIPKLFKNNYPSYYNNLKTNKDKLTSPYDLYITLQDILAMTTEKYVVHEGSACPQCQSLFADITNNRSCSDAAIDPHWCTCLGYTQYPINSFVLSATKYVIKRIHETINSYGTAESKKCQTFKFSKVLMANVAKDTYKNSSYLLILFETTPTCIFEATVAFQKEFSSNFKLENDVSRLDFYQLHSKCVQDSRLKKYCYCR